MITKTSCLTFIYSGVIMWKMGNNIRYKLMKSFRLIFLHGTSEYKNSYHKHQRKHPNSFVDIACQLGNRTDHKRYDKNRLFISFGICQSSAYSPIKATTRVAAEAA